MSLKMRHLLSLAFLSISLGSGATFASDKADEKPSEKTEASKALSSCRDLNKQAELMCEPEKAVVEKAPASIRDDLLALRLKQLELLREVDGFTVDEKTGIQQSCRMTSDASSKFASFHKVVAERCETMINKCARACSDAAANEDDASEAKEKKQQCLRSYSEKAIANMHRSDEYASAETAAAACVASVRQLASGGASILGASLANKFLSDAASGGAGTSRAPAAAASNVNQSAVSSNKASASLLLPNNEALMPAREPDNKQARLVWESEVLQAALLSTITAHPELKNDFQKVKWIYEGVVKKELGVPSTRELSDYQFNVGMQLCVQNERVSVRDFIEATRAVPRFHTELSSRYDSEAQRRPASQK